MYSETDFLKNRQDQKRIWLLLALCALPGLCLASVSVAMRWQIGCMVGLILLGAEIIFVGDLKLMPLIRYGHFLREVTTGLSRRTAGRLVRVSDDPIYDGGLWFREVTLNIYEDLSEDGERRFLLDSAKKIPDMLIGTDVALTSHGNTVLDVAPLGQVSEGNGDGT